MICEFEVMKLIRNKYSQLFNILLYSGMGCFSYLFLVIYTELPRVNASLTSPWAFLYVVLVFNGIGVCLMKINEWLKNDYIYLSAKRRQMLVYGIGIAIFLFLINYLLLLIVKWLIDVPDPWYVKPSGIRMLVVIWLVEMVVVSLAMVNNFYRHIIVLYKRNSRLEDNSMKARYVALQSQLNPHFLFNSLNTLISEIRYSPVNAELFTQHLSDVYRYILQCQEQRLVSLRSELVFLDSYLFLHKVRLGNCICLDNQVEKMLWEMKVPPLTLQLLAENIIKHNAINCKCPMTVFLLHDKEKNMLVMKNEIRLKKNAVPSGRGLKNLSERYHLLCNKDIVVINDGTTFTVKIPLLYE